MKINSRISSSLTEGRTDNYLKQITGVVDSSQRVLKGMKGTLDSAGIDLFELTDLMQLAKDLRERIQKLERRLSET